MSSPSNIQNSNERRSLPSGLIERLVDSLYQPFEHPFIVGFRDGFHCELGLLFGLSLIHEFPSNLDSRSEEGLGKLNNLQTKQVAGFLKKMMKNSNKYAETAGCGSYARK